MSGSQPKAFGIWTAYRRRFGRPPSPQHHGSIRENPHRLGKPLVGRELSGLHSARRGDYRIVYGIDEEARVAIVHRIQHRGEAYRPR